jgi:hypothetical protein
MRSGCAPPLPRATAVHATDALRPRRGSRKHHEYNTGRHHAAAQALVVPACTEVEAVEIVSADDLCQHLARGTSLSTSGAPTSGGSGSGGSRTGMPARLPVFHRQPGELPAGEDWQMLESPHRATLETRATVESIDVQGISHSVQATAYALDRCEAAHLVALAETTLAVIATEDGPDTLEVLLRSHGTYSARELISQHLPRTVVRAVLVDTDLTKTQAHRRLVDAVYAYLAFSRCLGLVLEGRLSMAKLRALLRATTRLQLHDARWIDRDTTGRACAENGRNAEDVHAELVRTEEGTKEDQELPEPSLPAHVRDQHARLHGPALLAAPLETFTQHVRAQAALCAPPASPVKTVHDERRVSYERTASGRAFLTLEGPITVLEPYYQRLQATARAVRAGRLQALINTSDTPDDGDALTSVEAPADVDPPEAVVVDERTLDQLMFDLAALAAPATYVPLEVHAPECTHSATGVGTEAGGRHSPPAASSQVLADLPPPPVVEKRRIRLSNPAGGPPIETYAVVHVPLQGACARPATITADHAPAIADSRRRRLPPTPPAAAGKTVPAARTTGEARAEPDLSARPTPPSEGTSVPAPGRPLNQPGEADGEEPVAADASPSAYQANDGHTVATGTGGLPRANRTGAAHTHAETDQTTEAVLPPLVRVQCPTEGEWLSQQAAVMVTVPVLHLLTTSTTDSAGSAGSAGTTASGGGGEEETHEGRSTEHISTRTGDVPAELTGISPIPADTARQIVSTQSVLYRILTDPATGTVLDETAQTYTIPTNVRRTVTAKHKQCAAPGCTRVALRCQADHILPFNHLLPTQGGLTVPENLQPLCQPCHQLKTQGLLTVKKNTAGISHWSGPLGRESVTLAPPSPHEVRATAQLRNLLRERAGEDSAGAHSAEAHTGPAAGIGRERGATEGASEQGTGAQPTVWAQDDAPPF